MARATLVVLLVAFASGCGSDNGRDAGTTTRTATVSAADAEHALETELGKGGGVVDLERPEQVMCVSEKGAGARWHCTVRPANGGGSYVCDIEVDPRSKRSRKSTCARID